MRSRNTIVELARFLFSILVVGYHVQMSMNNDVADIFENGALAVEFFFLLSGYFLARSIEKINGIANRRNTFIETLHFMKNKVKGIIPTHITAIIAMIAIILIFNLSNAGKLILNGLPSVFLVHMAVIWDSSYYLALIIPEWYLSAMLLSMLFIFPIGLLLRKKLKGIFIPLISVVIILIPLLAVGIPLLFPQNLIYFVRAWGELCVGMFAYYLSVFMSKREFNKNTAAALKIIEILCYCVPVILGIIPISATAMPICMAITVVCIFVAISITFADKGVKLTNEKINKVFAYLGSISLAIYLFHPVIISLIDYAYIGCEQWAKMLIVFPSSILLAVVFRLVCNGLRKIIANIKSTKQKALDGNNSA